MQTSVIDTERGVKVITNDFAVLRYDSDTPITLRKHVLTLGRFDNTGDADDELTRKQEFDQHPSAQYLHIEERSETWEEEIKCDCGLGDDPQWALEQHDPGCMLVQCYVQSKRL